LSESVVARRGDAVLRHAAERDLPAVDELAVECYRPIQESYMAMLGEEIYEYVRHEHELTWEQRKIGQNRRLFAEHPDWVWVLEEHGDLFGFVTDAKACCSRTSTPASTKRTPRPDVRTTRSASTGRFRAWSTGWTYVADGNC
jgi:hypothetical protein